jgi:hypothetical protein
LHSSHPIEVRECDHNSAAPHRGQSAPAGGRQHAHLHPSAVQNQNRNRPRAERTATEPNRRHRGQARDHDTAGRFAIIL